jgi:hypothetical protein
VNRKLNKYDYLTQEEILKEKARLECPVIKSKGLIAKMKRKSELKKVNAVIKDRESFGK